MSADIGPGDAVVCIKRPLEHRSAPWVFPPEVGTSWIVAVIGDAYWRGQRVEGGGVRLCGDGLPADVDEDGMCLAWPLKCFRKVPPPSADSLDRRTATPTTTANPTVSV